MKVENIWVFSLDAASLIDDQGNAIEKPSVEQEIPTMIVRVVYSLREQEMVFGIWQCLVMTLYGTPVAEVRPVLSAQNGPGIFSILIPVPAFLAGGQQYDIAIIPPGEKNSAASAVARVTI